MILVDTSIWVAHLRGLAEARALPDMLHEERVVLHPFVLGELVLGGADAEVRALLSALSHCEMASEREVHHLVEADSLVRSGIGWVDAHLLAACRLGGLRLWTADRSLADQARYLRVAWDSSGSS